MNKTDIVTAFRKDKQIRINKYFDECLGRNSSGCCGSK